MKLKIEEKYAILAILKLIMEADTIIHPKELEFMDKMIAEYGMSLSNLEEISEIDLLTGKSIISKMDAEAKKYSKEIFIKMALVDDDFDDREKAIIENIFK